MTAEAAEGALTLNTALSALRAEEGSADTAAAASGEAVPSALLAVRGALCDSCAQNQAISPGRQMGRIIWRVSGGDAETKRLVLPVLTLTVNGPSQTGYLRLTCSAP